MGYMLLYKNIRLRYHTKFSGILVSSVSSFIQITFEPRLPKNVKERKFRFNFICRVSTSCDELRSSEQVRLILAQANSNSQLAFLMRNHVICRLSIALSQIEEQ